MNNSLKDPDLFDRYAPEIINGHPEHFDAIEIQGVRGTDSDVTTDNSNPDAFSVYLHYKTDEEANRVGVQCVGDFADRNDARVYAAELNVEYGWPITDHTQDELACDRMLDEFLLMAAGQETLFEATTYVSEVAGITNLNVAATVLVEAMHTAWPVMSLSKKVGLLEEWRAVEQTARVEYPEPVDLRGELFQRYYGIIMAGAMLLQSVIGKEGVSDAVVEILGKANVTTTPEQLSADIERLVQGIEDGEIILELE